MKKLFPKALTIELILLLLSVPWFISAQTGSVSLENGFKNPPESAKPRTWWHWTNSNITKEGITKDLEWMKRAGIGGLQQQNHSPGVDLSLLIHLKR